MSIRVRGSSSLWAVVATLCLSFGLPYTLSAAPPFAHVFRIDQTENPNILSGIMTSYLDRAFLQYVSSTPFDSPDMLAQSMGMGAHFNATGDLLWSLRPAPLHEVFQDQLPPPSPDANTIQASAGLSPTQDPNHARVTYRLGTGLYRFGSVDAASLAPIYAYEARFEPPHETLYSFPGMNDVELLFRQDPKTISFLGVDAGGGLLFDRLYTTPAFLDAQGMEGFLQIATPWPRADGGYDFIAHRAETLPGSSGERPPYQCVIIRLDPSGNVLWARTLERDMPEPVEDLSPDLCFASGILPDGSVLFSFRDFELDIAGSRLSARSHVIKILPDGSLGWAQTFENALMSVGIFAEDAPYLYMWGAATSTGSAPLTLPHGILARIDAATGELTHEFWFPLEDDVFLAAQVFVYATSPDYIYPGRLKRESDQTFTLEITRLDRELANPIGFRQTDRRWSTGTGRFMDGRLLISEFDAVTHEIRAFDVTEELEAFNPTCPTAAFTPFPTTGVDLALMTSPFGVRLEAVEVEVTPANTALLPTTLPVLPLSLDMSTCAAAPPTVQ